MGPRPVVFSSITAGNVLRLCDWFEVSRIDAQSIAAEMVQLPAVWDWTD
jgi:hypothetical protein